MMESSMRKIIEKVKATTLGIVAFLLVTMSLFHIFFSSLPTDLQQNNLDYQQVVQNRDNLLQKYLEDLHQGNITISTYYSLTTQLLRDVKKKIHLLNQEKNSIQQEHSFRGRNSFRFWVFLFGLVIALLFFSCKSLFDDITKGSGYQFQFLSITGIVVSIFWLIHLIFYTQKDFTKNSYIITILICASLSTYFIYFLVKNFTYKDDIILKQLSLIDRIKTIHYPRVALKALYSERNDRAMLSTDTVKENTDNFDKDILNSLKNI